MKDKAKKHLMLGIIGGILTMIKLLINWIGRLGSPALLNGILCSNMSLGAILIFAA